MDRQLNAPFFGGLLVVGLLNFVPALMAQPTQAVEYGGIGGRPAYPQVDNPRTESIFIHTLSPGTLQDEGILLINNGTEEKSLLVYSVDSVTSSDGAFACRQLSDPKVDVGSWIVLSQSEVTLQPGTNQIVPFSITVPDPVDVGEHNGCIVIQEQKAEAEQQAGVNLSFRTGIRVAITVPGDIVRQLDISSFSYARDDKGVTVLTAVAKNSGNVSIDADVKVDTHTAFYQSPNQQGGQYPVLRGETSTWHFDVPQSFWGGWYTSTMTVTYDAHDEASIGQDSDKGQTELQTSLTFFVKPLAKGMIIELSGLVFILVLISLACLAAMRKRWIHRTWIESVVQPSDDMKKLAERHQVSWKLLAKVNAFKPPYTLKTGEKIKIPPTAEGKKPVLVKAKLKKKE